MPTATYTKAKISGSEKKANKNTYDISSLKLVTRKFLEVSSCNRAKQRHRNVQKKSAAVVHVQSCFFANSTYCCFHRSRRLALHDFIFCLIKP